MIGHDHCMPGAQKCPIGPIYQLREPTRSIVVIWVKDSQIESMAEIYSKSPVRAIGTVVLMRIS